MGRKNNSKLPRPSRRPPSGPQLQDENRPHTAEYERQYILDLMKASKRHQPTMEEFNKKHQKEIDKLTDRTHSLEATKAYRKKLDKERNKRIKQREKEKKKSHKIKKKKKKRKKKEI